MATSVPMAAANHGGSAVAQHKSPPPRVKVANWADEEGDAEQNHVASSTAATTAAGVPDAAGFVAVVSDKRKGKNVQKGNNNAEQVIALPKAPITSNPIPPSETAFSKAMELMDGESSDEEEEETHVSPQPPSLTAATAAPASKKLSKKEMEREKKKKEMEELDKLLKESTTGSGKKGKEVEEDDNNALDEEDEEEEDADDVAAKALAQELLASTLAGGGIASGSTAGSKKKKKPSNKLKSTSTGTTTTGAGTTASKKKVVEKDPLQVAAEEARQRLEKAGKNKTSTTGPKNHYEY